VPTDRPDRAADTTVVLTGATLTVADVEAVARHGAAVRLDDDARDRIQAARDVIDQLVRDGAVVYGVTTGFGDLATTFIDPADAGRLQDNLLMSHAAGVGRPFPREVVRAMLLLRANTLALGHSGCRPLVVDRLIDLLTAGIHPVVPEQGSLGASGDLAPLAHLALPLVGRGEVEVDGDILPARVALDAAGLEPLRLEAKEGLALLNGTQMMSALGALFLADADRLARTASVAAAMSVEALLGTDVAFSAAYQSARAACNAPTTPRATRSRIRTPCAACRRSMARCATRSTSSAACSTSSSMRPPTTRWSSRLEASPTRPRSRPAAAG